LRRTIIIMSMLAMSSCGVTAAPATTFAPLPLQPPSTPATTTTTTTTTTTVAPTTTIDPLVIAYQEAVTNAAVIYPRCAEWLPLLLEVGGQLEDWPVWSRVIWTESRCQPTADNGACVGLTQIYYDVHHKWLGDMGIDRNGLLEPAKNLRFAVALQASSGWSPWAYLNMP
jgi:ABC-type transport system substrate-binding protein